MRTSCHIRAHFVRSSRAGPSSRSGKCCNNSADFVDSCTSCRSTGIAKAFRVVSGRACYESWKNGRTNGGLGLCCIPIWYAHSLSQLLLLSINNNTIDRERISSLDGHIAGEASTWTIPPDLFKSVTSLFPYLALCGLYQSNLSSSQMEMLCSEVVDNPRSENKSRISRERKLSPATQQHREEHRTSVLGVRNDQP